MAINVVFYQWEKRTNSTKQPFIDGVQGTTYSCEINANCSIIAPQIEINFVGTGGTGNPTLFNYCYISDFTRYYFVRNWTWAPGKWIAQLSEDVLGTWRTNITNATEYVTRAAAAFDGSIVDTLYPTKAGVQYEKVPGNKVFYSEPNQGDLILSTISGSGDASMGATTFYALSSNAFDSLREQLLSSADYLNISSDEISADLTKALFNPYQYCVSCMWFPLVMVSGGSSSTPIGIGWWNMYVDRGAVAVVGGGNDTQYTYQSYRVPKHPQSGARGSYLNLAPYTHYTLYYPPFGEVELDGLKIGDASTIYVKCIVDAYTGSGYMYVSTDDPGNNLDGMASNIIAIRSAQVGVPVSLAQLSYNTIDSVGELVSTAITGVYGAVSGLMESAGHIGAAIGSAVQGDFDQAGQELSQVGQTTGNNIGDAVQHSLSEVQYKGNTGAISVYSTSPYLLARFYQVADDDNEHRGKPLCQVRQLSTLPGFVKCLDSDIAIAGTQAEADAIKSYLTNGCYIE